MSALAQALLEVQQNAPAIQKDGLNPHFRSKYVSLDTLMPTILPVLNEHGLVLMQEPTVLEGQPALRTRLIHAESGETAETTMLLVLAKEDPQGQGSALTYARRYALMAMLGLVADEDDDGNRAAPKTSQATGARADSGNDSGMKRPELLKKLEDIIYALNASGAKAHGHDTWKAYYAKKSEDLYGKLPSETTVAQLRSLIQDAEKELANATPDVPF